MGPDQRPPLLTALGRAQAAAYPTGEYVGQESFMRAAEIRRLAHQAQVGPGVPVLDLCCGVAGPGRMITAESGCRYLGVDQSASALATARQLAGELPCRFEHVHLPPLPEGRFEVVLLLETMLAFPDKKDLVEEIAHTLEPGGRFAFTVEEGRPLTRQEHSSAHGAIATALLGRYRANSPQIVGQIGKQATAELVTAHQLWSDWLGSGRVRKFAIVGEKR